MKFRLFISSVQSEFADERARLKTYIEKSPLLRRFFSVFVFESDVPPQDRRTDEAYLEALGQCDIYLALVGDRYAGDASVAVSPTEREYDEATRLGMRRIVLVKGDATGREDRERALLEKMSASVTWHAFADSESLLNWMLAALDKVMEDECLFRTLPFDRSECTGATLADLNENRIRWFVKKARKERNFALPEDASTLDVLTHLKLADASGGLTNAALLLFGKDPQRWHLTSEVKCVHWHGVQRVKPIRSYKVYKGTLFDMADQAVEFVMAKLDYSVGVRNHGPEVDRDYEIPEDVVSEAIVNRFEFGIVIRRKVVAPANDPVSGGVSGGVKRLLNTIQNNPGKRVPELAQMTGASVRTIERQLKQLSSCVEFRGAPKNGGYFVITGEENKV